MKNPREYYLSACFCACPVRRREAGRKPDTCELCGGWLPDYPVTDAEWQRERNHLVIGYLVWALVATAIAVASVLLGGGR